MVRRHAQVLSEALDLLHENPEFRFYIETWNEQMEPFLARRPERAAELSKAIREGKFEACGGVCNQHPGWMESESLVRDMVMGRRLFERFAPGLNLDVMIHNDVTPGPAQMPQILRKAGYRYYRINRPQEDLKRQGVPLDFRWKGLDGTELITSRGTTCGFLRGDTLTDDFAAHWEGTVQTLYQREISPELAPTAGGPAWMPVGCDDSRPLRFWQPAKPGADERMLPVPQLIRRWNQGETSHMGFATPLDFFRDLEKHGALPVHDGGLDPTMWTYWYGLNGNQGLRLWRTRTEQSLISGETFWNCAAFLGETYPQAEFDRLWRELLRVYSHAQMWLFAEDYRVQFDRVQAVHLAAAELKKKALLAITKRIRANGQRSCVVLFNDLPWERTEVVEVWAELQDRGATNLAVSDAEGNRLEHQIVDINWYDLPGGFRTVREAIVLVKVRVPASGYTTIYMDPAPGKAAVPSRQAGLKSLENAAVRITFSGRGIETVEDKSTGATYTDLGNVIYNRIRDTGPIHYGPVEETLHWIDAAVEEVTSGPLGGSFTLSGKLGPHFARVTGHLYPDGRIAFRAVIDSAGGSGHFMTTVALPEEARLSVDTHFAVEDRDVTKIHYGGLERKRENVFYGAHWTDCSGSRGGLTLVGTTGEKGYQYTPATKRLGHFLLMTLPHAGATIPKGTDAWERFVTPAREGVGRHEFDYQFLPHRGDWRQGEVVRRALEARYPITVMQLEEQLPPAQRDLPERRSFLRLEGRGVELSAFYRDGDATIARLYESSGKRTEATLQLPVSISAAREMDFNGQPLTKSIRVSGDTVHLTLEPWEIVTLSLVR